MQCASVRTSHGASAAAAAALYWPMTLPSRACTKRSCGAELLADLVLEVRVLVCLKLRRAGSVPEPTSAVATKSCGR